MGRDERAGLETDPVERDRPLWRRGDRLRLRKLSGPGAVEAFEPEGDRIVVGTHESADVRLEDSTVSRFHCEILLDGGRCFIVDRSSSNGTQVNGLRVFHAELAPLAILHLGHTALQLESIPTASTEAAGSDDRFGLLVGESRPMRAVFARLARAAATDSTVLLEAETGTGKELAAESLHRESARRDRPFVVIDCSSVPAELLESELFGHVRGSFTGATGQRQGAFREADGGTVFLDEIGELPAEMQPKLLRVLERRHVKAVGADTYVPVDVRIIAATNRNLFGDVNLGTFRSDLYYRLAVLTVRIPPLRERPEDIPILVRHLLDHIPGLRGSERDELSTPAFLDTLRRLPWPGNVRELRNYIERYLAFRELPEPPEPREARAAPAATSELVDTSLPYRTAKRGWSDVLEREYFTRKLAENGGSVARMAKAAGLDRMYAYRLLRRLGISYG